MARELEKTTSRPAPAPPPRPVLLSDRREGSDLWGLGAAVRPLAELCLCPEAETPFLAGLVGGPGAGKSFALRRLIETVEARARNARAPQLQRVVVARVEAGPGDPASAVASAVFQALEPDYAALADEAAHATVDPRHAASAAAERHDEIVARLEQERRARDEVDGRRARLTEALLFETPGSRVDSFARATRGPIESRLRRFGYAEGDADRNYRSLVRDLAGPRAPSRIGLFLRALWAYRGQTRLVVAAVVAFAVAFGLDRLRLPATQDAVLALSASLAPATDWIKAHDDALRYAGEAFNAVGALCLLVNVARAAAFTILLFKGLRMLNLDVRERRRELDASAARLERRVASLQMEADSAQTRAESLARRAGAGAAPNRPPGPAFLAPAPASERAARAFLDELGRAMAAASTPAPQRLLVAVDGLDALAPADALRFVETVARVAGPGAAVVIAADLARLGDARALAERLFEVVCDVGASASGDALAARLLSPSPAVAEEKLADIAAPLDEAETAALKAAAAWIGPRPRALKRFYNAYRLARMADAPRAAVTWSLAALMGFDPGRSAAVRDAFAGEGEVDPGFAVESLRGLDKAAARRAFAAARRWTTRS